MTDETADKAATPSWYDAAPDEVKGYIQNKGWDEPLKAVTSYQELEKFKGANEKELLRLPKDPNAEGAYDAIYNRLGRPETPDKYTLDLKGIELDQSRIDAYRPIAHKLGLTQKQFEALVAFQHESETTAFSAYQEQQKIKQEAEYKGLINEWGANAAEREEMARRGLRSVLPNVEGQDDLIQKIEGAIGTANTLKLFANIGEKMKKEDRIPSTEGDRPFGYTKEQAVYDRKALMDEIKADPARLDAYNKGRGKDYEKMSRLIKIAS